MVKRWLKKGAYLLWLIIMVIGLLEIAYRYQWVDFYHTERVLLNPKPHGKGMKILVLGDSFTANTDSYVDVLRDSMPEADVRNAALPGVGIREMSAVAARRLQEFQPDVLIYQFYTGNDLWDIRKTTSSVQIPLWRNLDWKATDYSLFLRYLNYKSGQLKAVAGVGLDTLQWRQEPVFAVDRYNAREKIIFRAEPDLIQNTIGLMGKRASDFACWTQKMDEILSNLPSTTNKVILLVIPHCAQVAPKYQERMAMLGAKPFGSSELDLDFPLLNAMKQHYRNDNRVQVISVLPALQQAEAAGSAVYYENDPHLNKAGQEICGKALWKAWED
ncbi:MAG: hypothetical protein IPL65_21485 [Lewinellaceae bacterium]|nr:hypothetical protein [Lewinellaceae bacterium]